MPGGLGPRFALEAGFLIVLAAVAAYARLDAAEIILVMAGGWLLTSAFEILAARRERLYPEALERRVETEEPVADVVEEPEQKPAPSWSRRSVEPTPPQPSEVPAQQEGNPEPESAPQQGEVDDDTGEIELPRRRRWFRRGAGDPETAADEVEARPSARHVRLIRDRPPEDGESEARKDVEAG